jgi:hypothetical protein
MIDRLIPAASGCAVLCAALVSLSTGPAAEASDAPEAGWVSLFDGKTLRGWTTPDGQPVTQGWEVVDGAIHRAGKGGQIVSEAKFDNFELSFEWKVAKGGNSGVKYRIQPHPTRKGQWVGCEYQILDDDNHPNGKKPTTRAGALYDLYAPDETSKELRPAGEYNSTRIVARGTKLEHWLNGKKILEVDTASPEWKDRIAKSKFKTVQGFAEARPSKILLQDHNTDVWFRDIKVRPLPSPSASE